MSLDVHILIALITLAVALSMSSSMLEQYLGICKELALTTGIDKRLNQMARSQGLGGPSKCKC